MAHITRIKEMDSELFLMKTDRLLTRDKSKMACLTAKEKPIIMVLLQPLHGWRVLMNALFSELIHQQTYHNIQYIISPNHPPHFFRKVYIPHLPVFSNRFLNESWIYYSSSFNLSDVLLVVLMIVMYK